MEFQREDHLSNQGLALVEQLIFKILRLYKPVIYLIGIQFSTQQNPEYQGVKSNVCNRIINRFRKSAQNQLIFKIVD